MPLNAGLRLASAPLFSASRSRGVAGLDGAGIAAAHDRPESPVFLSYAVVILRKPVSAAGAVSGITE
jgi:hypothetical protein